MHFDDALNGSKTLHRGGLRQGRSEGQWSEHGFFPVLSAAEEQQETHQKGGNPAAGRATKTS